MERVQQKENSQYQNKSDLQRRLNSHQIRIRSISPVFQYNQNSDLFINAISDTIAKLKAQENRQDQEMKTMKSQLNSFRQQAELNDNLHYKEIRRLKDLYEIKISGLQNESNQKVKQLKLVIEETKKQLSKSKNFSASLRQDIRNAEKQTKEIIQYKEREIKIIQDQDTSYRENYLTSSQEQILCLQQSLEKLQKENTLILQSMRQECENKITELKKQQEEKTLLIHSMQIQFEQLQEKKDQLNSELKLQRNETENFSEQLKIDVSFQEQDFARLRKAISNLHNQNKLLSFDYQQLEEKLQELKSKQTELKQEKAKYEKLVY